MTDTEAGAAGVRHPLLGEVGQNWKWLLAVGVVFVVLGFVGLGMLYGLTAASILFFGVLLLIGGGVQLVDSLKCRGWKSLIWHVFIAVLYILAGITVISDPLMAKLIFTLMLAGIFIAVGVGRIVMAVQLRPAKGWVWPLLAGLVSLLIGIMIAAKWPASGFWVIGLFVAIEMISHGWSYITIALAARSIAAETGR